MVPPEICTSRNRSEPPAHGPQAGIHMVMLVGSGIKGQSQQMGQASGGSQACQKGRHIGFFQRPVFPGLSIALREDMPARLIFN